MHPVETLVVGAGQIRSWPSASALPSMAPTTSSFEQGADRQTLRTARCLHYRLITSTGGAAARPGPY